MTTMKIAIKPIIPRTMISSIGPGMNIAAMGCSFVGFSVDYGFPGRPLMSVTVVNNTNQNTPTQPKRHISDSGSCRDIVVSPPFYV